LPPAESTPAGETAPLADSENEAEITPAEEVVPASASVPIIEASPVMETIPPAGSIPNPVQVPVRAPTLNQNSILPHIPVQDKDTELLSSAQNALGQNSLDDAMKKYTKIIKKGRLLDEVIHDLREAIYRYPVDVIVWQTLGDAYMRANRLQDALDAYTKAEEMLR
jgi:tetratricopeptide (TPR) repeat protein